MKSAQELADDLFAMTTKLDDYLQGNDLYKTVSVPTNKGDHLIKMTIGGMLADIDTLRELDPENPAIATAQVALEQALTDHSELVYSWLAREAESYLGSWKWFLQDCWDNSANCVDDYATEVPLRVRLEKLLEAGGTRSEMNDVRQETADLDKRLRAIWHPSDRAVIRGGSKYDRNKYWWLYGTPQPRKD